MNTYEVRQVFFESSYVESYSLNEIPNGHLREPDAFGIYKREEDGCLKHIYDFSRLNLANIALKSLSGEIL